MWKCEVGGVRKVSSLHLVLQQMGKDVAPEEMRWELRKCEVKGGREGVITTPKLHLTLPSYTKLN